VYAVEVSASASPTLQGHWVTEDTITGMAVSELGRKVLRLALETEKKRKLSGEDKKPKIKTQKTIKLEKGQTKLCFSVSTKTKVEI
jgi:hypothetical protein